MIIESLSKSLSEIDGTILYSSGDFEVVLAVSVPKYNGIILGIATVSVKTRLKGSEYFINQFDCNNLGELNLFDIENNIKVNTINGLQDNE